MKKDTCKTITNDAIGVPEAENWKRRNIRRDNSQRFSKIDKGDPIIDSRITLKLNRVSYWVP